MQRPHIFGLTLGQCGLLILAAIFIPAGWAVLCAAFRLSRRARLIGMALAFGLVIAATGVLIATAS